MTVRVHGLSKSSIPPSAYGARPIAYKYYASIPSRLAIGPAPTSISSASDSEPAFITNLDALRSDNPPHRHWPSRLLNDAADFCYSSCLALRLSLSIGLEEVDIQIPDYKRWTAAVKEVDTFGGMIRQCW